MNFKASKFAVIATVCSLWISGARPAPAQADTVTDLGGLASWGNVARAINDAGQVVGYETSEYGTVGNPGFGSFATEWSGGSVIDLGGLPGSLGRNAAYGINNAGKVVGSSNGYATEWSDGSVINLGGLPGSRDSVAFAINNGGQVVGASTNDGTGYEHATEWSGGSVIDLGELPGSTRSDAYGINDAGFVVGVSEVGGTVTRLNGSAVPSSTSAAYPEALIAFLGASTTLARRLDLASSAASRALRNGAAVRSSTSVVYPELGIAMQ